MLGKWKAAVQFIALTLVILRPDVTIAGAFLDQAPGRRGTGHDLVGHRLLRTGLLSAAQRFLRAEPGRLRAAPPPWFAVLQLRLGFHGSRRRRFARHPSAFWWLGRRCSRDQDLPHPDVIGRHRERGAYQWCDDRHPEVGVYPPVVAWHRHLAPARYPGKQPWAEVTGGIDRVAGVRAERDSHCQHDEPYDYGAEVRPGRQGQLVGHGKHEQRQEERTHNFVDHRS